jgi:hypothetical protein
VCWAEKVRDIDSLAMQFIPIGILANHHRRPFRSVRGENRRSPNRRRARRPPGRRHLCLLGGVEILDCLEFDDELRYVDAIDDAAFLAMDLEFFAAKDRASFFLDQCIRLSGDPAPASLTHFYIAYRAVVRPKPDSTDELVDFRGVGMRKVPSELG